MQIHRIMYLDLKNCSYENTQTDFKTHIEKIVNNLKMFFSYEGIRKILGSSHSANAQYFMKWYLLEELILSFLSYSEGAENSVPVLHHR